MLFSVYMHIHMQVCYFLSICTFSEYYSMYKWVYINVFNWACVNNVQKFQVDKLRKWINDDSSKFHTGPAL